MKTKGRIEKRIKDLEEILKDTEKSPESELLRHQLGAMIVTLRWILEE